MSLERYRSKRDFTITAEPSGEGEPRVGVAPSGSHRFVVQRHRARRLHYDFRLEIDGVLASWAIPKGPSLDSGVRRAAFHVEDHPLDYFDFEGTIPRGEYGAGDVIVWDWGTFEPEETDDPGKAVRKGELKMRLHGDKLRGRFTIVKMKSRDGDDEDAWLLIKKRDDEAVAGWDAEQFPLSVKTGRTNDEVKAGVGPAATWHSNREPDTAAAGGPPARPRTSFAGKAAAMPSFIEPMTAVLADRPFSDPDWLYEVKWDGFRVQAHVRDGKVALYTRRGNDAASYFPELAGPPAWIDAREAILDGEVVAVDERGQPSFQLLQARKKRQASSREIEGSAGHLEYVVFDLLYLDGQLLTELPLEERKAVLRSVLRAGGPIQFAAHVVGDGREFYQAVTERGLEGVMAKLRSSKYESGRRSPAWLKLKRRSEQEVVIGGWTLRTDSEDDLGALMVGVFDDGVLRPAGKVGTGFDGRERRRLLDLMKPLAQPRAPFRPVPREKDVRWIEPALVARVEFAEWTSDGNLRAPSYKGLELDADPRKVIRELARSTVEARKQAGEKQIEDVDGPEKPAPKASSSKGSEPKAAETSRGRSRRSKAGNPSTSASEEAASPEEIQALDALPGKGGLWSICGRQLKLSNLDKVIWPADGITKRELIRYHVQMAPYLLPYLRDRSLTLRRYPDGIEQTGFWQKQLPGHAPSWVDRFPWRHRSREITEYMVACTIPDLAWVANEAAIDLHPSTFKTADPDRPTWALVDIDPGTSTTWDQVLVLARLYRTALDHLGVRGFPKVTGQRGIQIWIPIEPVYDFDDTRDWVMALSRTIAGTAPDLISWEWEKSRRSGLARLDYTQNAWNKTLVAPYSVRPAAGAPVSAPISWDELDDPRLQPNRWTVRNVLSRLREKGDLFAPALELEQKLPEL